MSQWRHSASQSLQRRVQKYCELACREHANRHLNLGSWLAVIARHRAIDFLRKRKGAGRIAEDVESADLSGVSGTPTFFINGRRHYGVYDIDTLTEAVRAAKNRAKAQLHVTAAA